MRNYWRIILSLFLIGNALSVQAAVKSFTETFVLYTDSEGLTTAYNEGWTEKVRAHSDIIHHVPAHFPTR